MFWTVDQGQNPYFRVTVHDDIAAIVPGETNVHVFVNDGDRQLAIYASFTDGAFEDVTGHPYLTYTVTPPDIATAVNGHVVGTTAGIGTITVTTWDGRFKATISLSVMTTLSDALKPSSEQLAKRTSKHQSTLFIIAEGYQDSARFFGHAHKIANSLFRTEPYSRLKDLYSATAIFESSPARGVTIGSPVVASATDATKRVAWETPDPLPNPFTLPNERMVGRDTVFGLMSGGRISTPQLAFSSAPPQAPFDKFYTIPEARSIRPDPRRIPGFTLDSSSATVTDPRSAFVAFVQKFVQTAGQSLAPNDRVMFLVDDDVLLGEDFDVLDLRLEDTQPMVAFSIGDGQPFAITTVTAPLLDRTIVGPTLDERRAGATAAHELGHTYKLGDEYVTKRNSLGPFSTSALQDLERFENTQFDQTLRITHDPTSTQTLRGANKVLPDVTRIKWNVHRISKASPASAITAVAAGQQLAVAPGQASRWTPGEFAFLRNSITLAKNILNEARYAMIAVQVVSVDTSANKVVVSIPQGTDVTVVGTNPLLYVPQKRKDGTTVGLIDPAVLAYLAAQGPFVNPVSCTGTWTPQDNAAQPCPSIPSFSAPSVQSQAIGLYEGALGSSCGVYRPAGRCKMRNYNDIAILSTTGPQVKTEVVIVEFCFVCLYSIIDRLDPSQHEGLDKIYPRDC
jgi:hypothetical protein